MNSLVITGNLTKDAELVGEREGKPFCTFRIAHNHRYNEETDFFTVKCFGKTADFASTYFKKGTAVIVRGRIQNREYEKDGEKKTICEIVADEVEFAGRKAKEEDGEPTPKYTQPKMDLPKKEIDVDDLPF